LVAAESIACGTPVLCSNTTSLPEIVTNKEGVLVNPDNFQEIKAAMQTLMHSYKSFRAEDLHQTIEKRFGLRIFGENLSTIYKNILAN
jgi:glycosyltransferase involved in cell wall biosynthesis